MTVWHTGHGPLSWALSRGTCNEFPQAGHPNRTLSRRDTATFSLAANIVALISSGILGF